MLDEIDIAFGCRQRERIPPGRFTADNPIVAATQRPDIHLRTPVFIEVNGCQPFGFGIRGKAIFAAVFLLHDLKERHQHGFTRTVRTEDAGTGRVLFVEFILIRQCVMQVDIVAIA
ncbi:hypothetical protein Senen10_04764 [Salmonella enterica subsp. enterica]